MTKVLETCFYTKILKTTEYILHYSIINFSDSDRETFIESLRMTVNTPDYFITIHKIKLKSQFEKINANYKEYWKGYSEYVNTKHMTEIEY